MLLYIYLQFITAYNDYESSNYFAQIFTKEINKKVLFLPFKYKKKYCDCFALLFVGMKVSVSVLAAAAVGQDFSPSECCEKDIDIE